MNETAACPPSPIVVDDASALPFPTSSPSSSVPLLAWSLDANSCVPNLVMYLSRYCTLRFKIFFFSVFKFFKIYFWLCWVFVAAWAFSNCDEQGCFLVEVYRLLAVVVSLVAKHRP